MCGLITPFLLSGLIGRMRGQEVSAVKVDFDTPANITLQCDGEVFTVEDSRSLEVKKAKTPLSVLVTK